LSRNVHVVFNTLYFSSTLLSTTILTTDKIFSSEIRLQLLSGIESLRYFSLLSWHYTHFMTQFWGWVLILGWSLQEHGKDFSQQLDNTLSDHVAVAAHPVTYL